MSATYNTAKIQYRPVIRAGYLVILAACDCPFLHCRLASTKEGAKGQGRTCCVA